MKNTQELENEQYGVLFLAKGEDGENEEIVAILRDWVSRQGCSIIKEGKAKYTAEDCQVHYCKMTDAPYYPELEEYLTSGTSYGFVVIGTKDQLRNLKTSTGKAKNPSPNSLRGFLFASTGRTDTTKNFVHCSDIDELDLDEVSPLAVKEISNFSNVMAKTQQDEYTL